MHLQTLAHATMLVSTEKDSAPVLATDPWLFGSCYWRSWWLSRQLEPEQIERVARSRYIYLSHEHPDHLHVPSLRRVASGSTVLVPDFLEMKMDSYLRDELGLTVQRLPPNQWVSLGEGVRVLSLPYPSNDSVLLVDTPEALLINLNDVKPIMSFLEAIGQMTRQLGKPRVVLRSYSLAGPANSFFVEGQRRPSKSVCGYVLTAGHHAAALGGDFFVPFASQAVFRRRDSEWANEFSADYALLKEVWMADTRLLPPYVSLDLGTFEYTAPELLDYRPSSLTCRQKELVSESHQRDARETLNGDDVLRLQAILNEERLALLCLFPGGIAFVAGDIRLTYDPVRGKVREGKHQASVTVDVPTGPFRDALQYGHFTDLFIGLFCEIHLEHEEKGATFETLYRFFFLRDYGYGGVWKRLHWLYWAWRRVKPKVPPPPTLADEL
jgi:hypothetical protein